MFRRLFVSVILFSAVSISALNMSSFSKSYQSLGVKNFLLAPARNIEEILAFAAQPNIGVKVAELKKVTKNCSQGLPCRLIQFELKRLEKRLSLAKKLRAKKIKDYAQLKNHPRLAKDVYKHAVFEWTSDPNFSFKDIKKFEEGEIERIRKELSKLARAKSQKLRTKSAAEAHLKATRKAVAAKVGTLFTRKSFDQFEIKINSQKDFQHVPGYYDSTSQTFFYTLRRGETNSEDLDWLFLHEAVPGHHMQKSLDKESLARRLFSRGQIYHDFLEGWAAYVEIYGDELGAYRSEAAKRKALEWDLLRSIRVFIDIGLHMDGWSEEKAYEYWVETAPEVEHFAEREIKRMRRWPAQVISYEYGKMKMIQARDKFIKSGKSLLEFHEKVLSFGQIPTSLLEEVM